MSLRNYFVIYFVLEYACCDACDVCIFLLYKFLIFPFKKFSECSSINKDFSKVGSTTQALVLPTLDFSILFIIYLRLLWRSHHEYLFEIVIFYSVITI